MTAMVLSMWCIGVRPFEVARFSASLSIAWSSRRNPGVTCFCRRLARKTCAGVKSTSSSSPSWSRRKLLLERDRVKLAALPSLRKQKTDFLFVVLKFIPVSVIASCSLSLRAADKNCSSVQLGSLARSSKLLSKLRAPVDDSNSSLLASMSPRRGTNSGPAGGHSNDCLLRLPPPCLGAASEMSGSMAVVRRSKGRSKEAARDLANAAF
mmetsp:Transcript_42326/g.95760  ORF Transcript_42326/g.95760 Transcript_42326/m.95760 type:complete len:209 (-) Transcript_42326:109-735(-)